MAAAGIQRLAGTQFNSAAVEVSGAEERVLPRWWR